MSLILSGTDGLSDIDGSAATPAIRGTDANTGIFFPAADTIAFSEGGVEAMRIDSSGNLGIGLSSPTQKLQVSGTISAGNIGPVLYGRYDATYPTSGAGYFGLSTHNLDATSGGLFISTLASGTLTERMRIDSAGLVGIGGTPSYKLDVIGVNSEARLNGSNAARMLVTGGSYTWAISSNYYIGAAFTITNTAGGSTLNDFVIDTSGNTKFNSGYGSAATAYGCRAWVNFNGTGTVAIRASGNVTSITDNGVGDYTVNFTTAMPDASYSVASSITGATTSNVTRVVVIKGSDTAITNKTTSAITIQTGSSAGGTLVDVSEINISIFR